MIHGTPRQTQSSTNLDYLSLAPATLRDALRLIDPEAVDTEEVDLGENDRELTDQQASRRSESLEASVSALTVTREVRETMEEVLGLLNEALAAQGR